ncbi:hypothetical protein [Streptomyces sp. NPDC055013]
MLRSKKSLRLIISQVHNDHFHVMSPSTAMAFAASTIPAGGVDAPL